MLDQFRARHDAAHMMHQVRQNAIFMRGQFHRFAIHTGTGGARIDHQLASLQRRGRVTGGAAQQGAQARQQLFGNERLGEVIVSAGIKASHLLAPRIAGGQNQDREGFSVRTPFLQDADAVHLRQAEVQDHRIIGFGVAQKMAILAICGEVHSIA